MTKDIKRQEILKTAVELFAKNGFRGTTTRDLASHADVNEAIIFRHFKTKEELYRAILEEKVTQSRDARCEQLEELAALQDDRKFFEAVGHHFLERHEQDTTFMRLLLFSALEGHELSEMFLSSMPDRDPIATYLQQRIAAGAIRQMDPELAARAFVGMFVCFIQMQEIFGQKKVRNFDRTEVVQTFVSIFLDGIQS